MVDFFEGRKAYNPLSWATAVTTHWAARELRPSSFCTKNPSHSERSENSGTDEGSREDWGPTTGPPQGRPGLGPAWVLTAYPFAHPPPLQALSWYTGHHGTFTWVPYGFCEFNTAANVIAQWWTSYEWWLRAGEGGLRDHHSWEWPNGHMWPWSLLGPAAMLLLAERKRSWKTGGGRSSCCGTVG